MRETTQMMFHRTPGTWGLPTSWHGWAFLALWAAAVCAVVSGPASVLRPAWLVTLFVLILFVATRK
jgi:hypothetical protein